MRKLSLRLYFDGTFGGVSPTNMSDYTYVGVFTKMTLGNW